MQVKLFIDENKVFLVLYALFLCAGAVLIACFEKGDEIIYANSLHNVWLDRFFLNVTRLAEFPAFLLIVMYAVFSGLGRGFLLWVNIMFVFLFTSLFKYMLFADEVRPAVFFEGKTLLTFTDGLEVARYNSFPSGHTATAFAVFFMLSIMLGSKKWSVVLFTLALLVAVSRVYLMQHFFRDVYFGSLLAVVVTTAVWLAIGKSSWYNHLSWKDKAILK